MKKEDAAKEIEKIVEPYLKISGNTRFLAEDDVDSVIDEIDKQLDNVFTSVKDCGKGVKKLVVEKLARVHMMQRYEVIIR